MTSIFCFDLFFQTLFAGVELFEVRQSLGFAGGDVVQRLLHAGGEVVIDEVREIVFEEPGHGHRGEGGD